MAEREKEGRTEITIAVAARRTGLSPSRIRRCIRRRLVAEALTAAELARLRRIRRLSDLGINLAGVEVILRMRRRMEALQEELVRLRGAAGRRERVQLWREEREG